MAEFCPNKASKEFKELASIFGEDKARFLWMRNKGNHLEKAPNGADSKLFHDLLEYFKGDRAEAIKAKAKTYTNEFFNWFGNWTQDNKENVSKVVDENGEPLIVYHTVKPLAEYINELANILIFDIYHEGVKSMIYTTNSKKMSESYANNRYRYESVDEVKLLLDEEIENLLKNQEYMMHGLDRTGGYSEQWLKDNDYTSYDDPYFINRRKFMVEAGKEGIQKSLHKIQRYEFILAVPDSIEYTKLLFLNIKHPLVIDAKGLTWYLITDDNNIDTKYVVEELNRRKEIRDNIIKLLEKKYVPDEFIYTVLPLDEANPTLFEKIQVEADALYEQQTKNLPQLPNLMTTRDVEKKYINNNTYDGIIFTNILDFGGFSVNMDPNDVYASKSPNQIKSAVANKQNVITGERGFSTENNNIYKNISSVILNPLSNRFVKIGRDYSVDDIIHIGNKNLLFPKRVKNSEIHNQIISIAKQLGVKIQFANPIDDKTTGEYSDGVITLYINPENKDFTHTFFHELLHACAAGILNADESKLTEIQKQARDKLNDIYEFNKNKFKAYGFKSIHEFVSELITNKEFQEKLKRTEDSSNIGDTTIFTQIVQFFSQLFNKFKHKNNDIYDLLIKDLLDPTNIIVDFSNTILVTSSEKEQLYSAVTSGDMYPGINGRIAVQLSNYIYAVRKTEDGIEVYAKADQNSSEAGAILSSVFGYRNETSNDNSSLEFILEVKSSEYSKSTTGTLRTTAIESSIINTRDIFILQQVEKYMSTNPNATSADIYGVRIGSAVDWDEAAVKRVISEQQEKMAKVFGLEKRELPSGGFVYTSSDKSKDSKLRVCFVNSITGQDWTDEDGVMHKGMFEEGSKSEEAAWNAIYISLEAGDATTFTHEMAHYYIRTFWESQAVQDALLEVDKTLGKKDNEEAKLYSRRLEEKLVEWLTDRTMRNQESRATFWGRINSILHNIGSWIKQDENVSNNILDSLQAAFLINQDLADRAAEIIYFEKYIGPVEQTTRLSDEVEELDGTTFWKIKSTLESREKSERSRGKDNNYDLLNIQAHLQKIQKRSITSKDDVASTVSDFLLLADEDVKRAITTLSNIILGGEDAILNLDVDDFMHLKTDVVGYYDTMLTNTIDEYLRGSKTISDALRKDLLELKDNIRPNLDILKNAFDRVLKQYIDKKIELYAEELVTVGDKDQFITNMKLWARNQIGEGKLMFLENALGPAVVSRSPIVRLVEYLVTAQNRISYESALKVGHELIDRYKKCASIGKKIMSINFMKQFCELDDDGNPTGYFAREYNYGKLYKMRDKVVESLVDKYGLKYDESTNQIVFDNRDQYIKYMTDFYNEMNKFANFRYKKEYYIERAKILSPKTLDKQRNILKQIDTLLAKATDKDLKVPVIFNLSSEEIHLLENLRKEKESLANPYTFVYNADGSINHMEEKSGEELNMALELMRWNSYKADKIKYKSNFEKFNLVREHIVKKYGEDSKQVKLFDHKYKARRISSKFYEALGERYLTPELQELYARKQSILNAIIQKKGYYQPNLKKLNDEAFAELKHIDEEISKAYSRMPDDAPKGNGNFNDLATKPWIGEYDDSGNLTANPVYNYFADKERAERALRQVPSSTESKYTFTSASGNTQVLTVFKYTRPSIDGYIEDTLLGEYSELDLNSELVNTDFDGSLQEELQPKNLEEFKNKNWLNIQANSKLKIFYDGLLQVMEESYKMLPNFDAARMKYVLPQMRDRDAKLIFRNRHLLTNMGASVADAFSIVETDTKYNESFSQRADGSIVETIPIRWVSKMKDPSIICTDLVKSVTLFYEMAQNYKNKAEINPTLQAMLFMVQGGYSQQTVVDGNSQLAERIQKYLLMYVYGRTRTGFDSKKPMDKRAKAISQLTDTILSKAHGKLMSHNWRAVLKNFVDSFLTDMGEIVSGKYITVKDALWANKEMAMEIFSTTGSFGRANNKSKIAALMLLNGASGNISELFGQHNETWLRRVISKHFAMGEYTLVDYTFKGHLTAALYHSIRLVKNPITKKLEFMTKDLAMFHYHDAGLSMEDGVRAWKKSKFTLFDAYDVDDKGNAVVKTRYEKYVYPTVKSTGIKSRRLVNQVTGIIRERSSVINGILDQSGSSAWKQNVVGALVLQMRGWMISLMWDNLKDGNDFAEYESQWRLIIDNTEQPITTNGPGISRKNPNINGIEKKIVNEDPEYKGQYNFETGTVERGQWRGLGSAYKHALGDLVKRMATFYKHSRALERSRKLTRNERYKLRRLNTMAATFLIVCGLTYITTGLRLKYPDEWYLHLLNAVNVSVISERASQIPVFAPLSILDIVNSIVISKTLIEDADKFYELFIDLVEMTDDATVDMIDSSEYSNPVKSGAYKGIQKVQRDALKVESYLFPDYSIDNVFRSMTKTGNDASINYYILNVSPTKQAVGIAGTLMPWMLSPVGLDMEIPEKTSGSSWSGSSSLSNSWSGGKKSYKSGWHK